MNDDIEIHLFDIDSSNISELRMRVAINQNAFLLCLEGSVTVEMDEHTYDIKAGDLYVLPAFANTVLRSVSSDMRGLVGMADFDFVLNSLDGTAATANTVYIRFHPHISLSPEQCDRIVAAAHAIRRRYAVDSPLRQHIISTMALALCYEVVDAFVLSGTMQPEVQTRQDKIFQRFIIDLYDHACHDRDVAFYASQQCLTPRYFASIITGKSGITPSRWISMFVINEAKRLLDNPKVSIKEISQRLNFANQSLFGRYFNKHTGMYPTLYRSMGGRVGDLFAKK